MDIRVILCNEQRLVRAGLRSILEAEPDIEIVGEAAHGADVMSMAVRLNPTVVVMDVKALRTNEGAAVRELVEMRSGRPSGVVMLASPDEGSLVTQALLVGARGFLLKEDPAEQLIGAVRMVAAGAVVLTPSATRHLLHRLTAEQEPVAEVEASSLHRLLTSRELEVLRHLAQGRSTRQVASSLYISETTVRSHIHHLLQKLELRSRAQAIALAYRCGLVTSPPHSAASCSPGKPRV